MSATYSEAYPLHGGWLVIVDGFAAWALDAQEARRLAQRNEALYNYFTEECTGKATFGVTRCKRLAILQNN